MFNSVISYVSIQDGVKTENTHYGVFEQSGSFYRVKFTAVVDGKESEHTYVKTGDGSFKITVKGDTFYSVTVKQGEKNSAILKTSGVEFPFDVVTNECLVTANPSGMEIYADYDIISFGQRIKNRLKLTVTKKGEILC